MLKYCGVLVLSIILVLSSAGCGMGRINNVTPNQYNPHSANRLITQDRAQIRTYTSFDKNASDRIRNDVTNVSGVSKAAAFVYNSDVVVGIQLKSGETTWRVEQKVIQVVRNARPGFNVHVTADTNLYTRIESIRHQMALHPNHDYSGDITILIHDINRATAPTPTPNHWHTPAPTHGHTPAPTHGHTPAPTHGHTPAPTHGHTPAPTHGHTPSPSPKR